MRETVSPTLDSLSAVTERSLSAAFSEPMLAPGVTTPGNYAVSGLGAGTLGAHPTGAAGTGPCGLTWSAGEMRNGATVTVTATGLQDLVGNPIAPAHIPVTDTSTLSAYAANLEYLDEKTQVTMKVDCYDQVIVDFDKTVTLGGIVWYLNANQISVDAKTGIRQSLELVRWA